MEIVLDRAYKKKTYTVGWWYVDGVQMCNTMEDADRGLRQDMPLAEVLDRKIYGETAIPTGTYTVKMTYSPRFRRMMPEILDVKGFSGIRIHSGTTALHTQGCIILGDNTQRAKVLRSKERCSEFEKMLKKAGGTAKLTIK